MRSRHRLRHKAFNIQPFTEAFADAFAEVHSANARKAQRGRRDVTSDQSTAVAGVLGCLYNVSNSSFDADPERIRWTRAALGKDLSCLVHEDDVGFCTAAVYAEKQKRELPFSAILLGFFSHLLLTI